VAWIPEGLSATIVMLLSIAAGRLAKEKVLVKNLQGVRFPWRLLFKTDLVQVETLGALTMLCTDKTGTLTQNKMTVSYLATPTSLISASVDSPESDCLAFQINQSGVSDLLLMCALCSHTKMDHLGTAFENRKLFGDATEIGLVQFAGMHLPYTLYEGRSGTDL
jgi:sodium/potassium-transporting ATPase subunit alpha